VKLDLVPGAVAAACRLSGARSLPVVYMDLSGASADQAFEWLCAPAHLDWSASRGTVRVTAAVLGASPAPWTYDVAALAVPEAREFEGLADTAKISERSAALAEEFLAAVRKAAGVAAPEDCFWLAPGQVVVFGDGQAHGRVARLIAELEKGEGDHGELGRRAAERRKARAEALDKAEEAREKGAVYGALYWSSWQLLAAAAGGESEPEALARLQWAWPRDFAAKLAADEKPLAALRSAWALSESSLALPHDRELKAAAADALARTAKSCEAALARAGKSPEDGAAWLAALYAALGLRNGKDLRVAEAERPDSYRARLLDSVKQNPAKDPAAAAVQMLARILLAGPDKDDAANLAKLVGTGLPGDDLNALAAVAAYKLGGEMWNVFRAGAQAKFSQAGVSESVVIMANRMCKSGLPSAR
jgi:hypothetical protein